MRVQGVTSETAGSAQPARVQVADVGSALTAETLSRDRSLCRPAALMLDTSGVLHIEAPKDATFTLGQVSLNGRGLSAGRVGAYRTWDAGDRDVVVFVNGKRSTGHPAPITPRPL